MPSPLQVALNCSAWVGYDSGLGTIDHQDFLIDAQFLAAALHNGQERTVLGLNDVLRAALTGDGIFGHCPNNTADKSAANRPRNVGSDATAYSRSSSATGDSSGPGPNTGLRATDGNRAGADHNSPYGSVDLPHRTHSIAAWRDVRRACGQGHKCTCGKEQTGAAWLHDVGAPFALIVAGRLAGALATGNIGRSILTVSTC